MAGSERSWVMNNAYATIAWKTRPGVCMECWVAHAPDQPHNRDSLEYQRNFYGKNGRLPTWEDAMAHCLDDVRDFWTKELDEMGIDAKGEDSK